MMHPAVFLDRDGVLCTEKSYITHIGGLDIFPYAKSCVQEIRQKGFLAICITNQSAVARGMMTEEALREINEYLVREIGLDALYYCPHHPDGIGKYRLKCNCRKPDTGMVERAIQEFEIDRDTSYMLGDRASDIICGQRAGLKTVLLESGYGSRCQEQPVAPDYIYCDLKEFVQSQMLSL